MSWLQIVSVAITGALSGGGTAVSVLAWLSKTFIGKKIDRSVDEAYDKKRDERIGEINAALEEKKAELNRKLQVWESKCQKLLDENKIRFSRFHEDQANTIQEFYKYLVRMEKRLRAIGDPLKRCVMDGVRKNEVSPYDDFTNSYGKCRNYFDENRIKFGSNVSDQIDDILNKAYDVYLDIKSELPEANSLMEGCTNIAAKNCRIANKLDEDILLLRKALENEFRLLLSGYEKLVR